MSVSINGTGGITFADTSTQSTGGYTGFRNRIINGAMMIDQRGLTGPLSGYFVDRWQVGGVSTTAIQTSGLPTGFAQAVSISRNVEGTAYITQNIESKNVTDLNGQTVTVSFFAKNVSGVGSITANLSYANASDNFSGVTAIQTVTASASPSSSWTYYTASFNALPSSVVNGLQLKINAVIASSGTLEITGVQLEKGSVATPFEFRPYGQELELCQRYLPAPITYYSGNFLSFGSSTTGYSYYSFSVTPRVAPTGISYSNLSHFTMYGTTGSANPTSIALQLAGLNSVSVAFTSSTGIALTGQVQAVLPTNTAAQLLFTGCEL